MGIFGKYEDPIEVWMRKLIASIPRGLGRPNAMFTTVSMLEEGLNVYLAYEQDPYWGVESLAGYLSGEGVPIPRNIVEEMLAIAGPETSDKVEDLLQANRPDLSLAEYVAGLAPLES